MPARHRRPPATPGASEDDLLAAVLVRVWELASGHELPRDVPLDQLTNDELIAFWADDPSRTAGRHAARIPRYDQQAALQHLLDAAGEKACPMLAFDLVGFTRPDRDQDVRRHIHKMLYEQLEQALEESRIPLDRCYHAGRGDGPLIVVPPDISAEGIINLFPARLSDSIRRYNRMSCPAAQIQVRAAAHLGTVYHDGHDLVSDDINLLFRILDARPLRTALASTDASLALAISGPMYDSVVRGHPALVGPARPRHINTTVKGTRVNAWIYVPGVPLRYGLERYGPRAGSRYLDRLADLCTMTSGNAILARLGGEAGRMYARGSAGPS
jgi:hypothetical protein